MAKTDNIFLLLFYLSLFISSINSFEQRSDCVESCAHLDTSQEFGECLSKCSRRPRKDNLADVTLFATPPKDVRVETNVIMDEGKILETTIYWTADDSDIRRTGFYLRYTAVNSSCQKHFPGFFTSSISASERSLTIPAAFNGHPLIIDHSCTYRLQIRSIPYPSGDDKFIIEKHHTVPECIDKYCSCKENDVSKIRDLKIIEENGYQLKWKFDEKKQREYHFYVDVYERIRLPFKSKNDEKDGKDEQFTYRIINQDPFEINIKSNTTKSSYSYNIPFEFSNFQQYKISIFAVDDRFCHNEDEYIIFNTTNITTIIDSSQSHSIDSPAETTVLPNDTVISKIRTSDNYSDIIKKTVLMESTVFVIFIISIACMSPICTFIVLFLIKRRKKEKKQQNRFLNRRSLSCSRHSIMETNILYRPPQNNDINGLEWQIRGQDVAVGTVIGEGAFGLVFKGILRGPNGQIVRVAVKQLKANALDEEREEFIGEIQMMQTVGQHDNIVAMYGYCMDDNSQCMIMEYVPFGDLKHYLQNVRKQMSFTSSTRTIEELTNVDDKYYIETDELISFSRQISNGMSHLESLGIIHRDLAARNILVGTGKVLKISDFGMSRPGVYIKMSKGVIPLRWLSPEAIKDNTYSAKSDVWAYGVLLWEIATLGAFPYANIADKDILSHLTEGNRLERPPKCLEQIYSLVNSCWNLDPRDRPTFLSIVNQIDEISSEYSSKKQENPIAKLEQNV